MKVLEANELWLWALVSNETWQWWLNRLIHNTTEPTWLRIGRENNNEEEEQSSLLHCRLVMNDSMCFCKFAWKDNGEVITLQRWLLCLWFTLTCRSGTGSARFRGTFMVTWSVVALVWTAHWVKRSHTVLDSSLTPWGKRRSPPSQPPTHRHQAEEILAWGHCFSLDTLSVDHIVGGRESWTLTHLSVSSAFLWHEWQGIFTWGMQIDHLRNSLQ